MAVFFQFKDGVVHVFTFDFFCRSHRSNMELFSRGRNLGFLVRGRWGLLGVNVNVVVVVVDGDDCHVACGLALAQVDAPFDALDAG